MQSMEEGQEVSILLEQIAVKVDGTETGVERDSSLIVAGEAVLEAHF